MRAASITEVDAVLPAPAQPETRRTRPPAVPSAMLGMLVFIVTETMMFAGFISAFTISRANAGEAMWPPPGQPRLPAQATLLNTAVLLLSGVLLFVAYRLFKKEPKRALLPYVVASLLGAAFVALQGREWLGLLSQGMTLTSSTLGAFFYLIVGAHAAHAVCALLALGIGSVKLLRGTLSNGFFIATLTFWTFVVGMWPIIYLRVYF
jgi:cytochrome c oxidase subunit 3